MDACKVLELATVSNIVELIKLAELEIKELAIKQKHGKTELQRFKKIKKYLENSENEKYKTTWIDGNFQCFSNGYSGFFFKNHMKELPTSQEKTFDLLQHIPRSMDEYITVQLDIADIKAKIKIHNSTQKNIGRSYKAPCHYDINENRYNARYILDCFEILGGKNITFKQPPNGKLDPSIFESENGTAILLPVRKPKEEEKAA